MWKRLLPVLLGLGLFAVMFGHVNWPKTWSFLKTADPFLCVATLVCYLIMIYLKSVRWSYLIQMQGARYSIWNCFLIYMSTLAMGNLTLGRAGDFAKIFFINKD